MRASRRKIVLSRIVLAVGLIVAAWPGLTAPQAVQAQGGLPADPQALVDRVTAALAATEAYTRYETAVTYYLAAGLAWHPQRPGRGRPDPRSSS